MDGAWLGSIDISIRKARTARYFDMNTGDLGALSQPGGSLYNIEVSNGGLITFPGGIPLRDGNGEIIGGIGVSGSIRGERSRRGGGRREEPELSMAPTVTSPWNKKEICRDGRQQSGGVHGSGQGRGPGYRLPDVGVAGRAGGEPGERGPQGAARRDPEVRGHQHLRLRSAHGARAHHRARRGSILGHEITGEVVEVGPGVEFIKVGDLCSVPFNISCGRCRNCKEGHTGVCLNVNPDRPGSAYGYVDMGGWVGGQAEYVMVPYADWNLLKFPDKDQAMEKILDLTMLSDIFPTGYHGCVTAGVTTGSTVYIAGAGPVGLAAATSAFLLGAAVVIVGDLNEDRLAKARSFGCETIDVSKGDPRDQIEQILGVPEVDAAVDAVGFEARGHGGEAGTEKPATVLNTMMDITRAAGQIGIPGLYVTGDPGAADEAAQHGSLSLRIGLGWAKSHAFVHRPVPGHALQPAADDGHPARPGHHRQERQRHADPPGTGTRRLRGVRPRRSPQVRTRPTRHDRPTRNRVTVWWRHIPVGMFQKMARRSA